jgi:hypothetical protein
VRCFRHERSQEPRRHHHQLNDDDLGTISDDDALVLYKGLSPHAGASEIDAALARLRAHIWQDGWLPSRRLQRCCIRQASTRMTSFSLCP